MTDFPYLSVDRGPPLTMITFVNAMLLLNPVLAIQRVLIFFSVLDHMSFQKAFIDISVTNDVLTYTCSRSITSYYIARRLALACAQYLRARNNATPALIHLSSSSLEGSSTHRQKLVECPVVDKVPARDSAL